MNKNIFNIYLIDVTYHNSFVLVLILIFIFMSVLLS